MSPMAKGLNAKIHEIKTLPHTTTTRHPFVFVFGSHRGTGAEFRIENHTSSRLFFNHPRFATI
jgi:hypothetical protein